MDMVSSTAIECIGSQIGLTMYRSRSIDLNLSTLYIKNSLPKDSPKMDEIRNCARKNGITVALGFSENYKNSLYISQCTIGHDGEIKMHRRKIKPTHMERTVFGDGSGDCLRNVVDTPCGRVGSLTCWEHTQPLLKYHTYLQREAIHIASWPPVFDYGGEPDLWSMSTEGKSCGYYMIQTFAVIFGSENFAVERLI